MIGTSHAISDAPQLLWDDAVVDEAASTAERRLHEPSFAETVLVHDAPWEGDACNFHNILADRDDNGPLYRLYYLGWTMEEGASWKRTGLVPPPHGVCVCYAESRDGLVWTKPALGLRDFEGSRENNVILDKPTDDCGEFFVFRDDNPACPPGERYKGLSAKVPPQGPRALRLFTSPDAIRFEFSRTLSVEGSFDSLNTAFFDLRHGLYHLYFRGIHRNDGERNGDCLVRDIRHTVSADFRSWSAPERLRFLTGDGSAEGEDYPLYTNCIEPYMRDPTVLVGFPTRYVEPRGWTRNHDFLPDLENRRAKSNHKPPWTLREGTALTDCVFAWSRDGRTFRREDDAFLRPGPERHRNWVYGTDYPARGLVRTPGWRGGADELSLYLPEGHGDGEPTVLDRYTLRMDGFISRHAPYAGARLVTKPIVFQGGEMRLNFSTSARGRVRVALRGDGGRTLESVELFGDQVDRPVPFEGGDAAQLAGRPVVIEFDFFDADLYSFRFARA